MKYRFNPLFKKILVINTFFTLTVQTAEEQDISNELVFNVKINTMKNFSSLSQKRKRIVDISVIKVFIKKYMTLYNLYSYSDF